MIRRPPRSTLFPSRRSSDLDAMHTLFVFVQCELGRTYDVAAKLVDEIEGVAEVYSISGEYDLLVKAHPPADAGDRKSTRLNSSHQIISYAVFCLKKKK